MDPELSLYIDKAQLRDDETRLIFNPPCKIYSQITEFISANPNNVDSIGIPKSQNCFFLYRKNYNAKHKSHRSKKDWKILSKEAGNAWHNESNEVKSYFKVLAKLAFQKNKLSYENLLLRNCIFIVQQPGLQHKKIDNNGSAVSSSPDPYFSSLSSTCYYSKYNASSQPKLQQKQTDNNDHEPSSSLLYPSSTFSCTSNNTSLPHFMTQQPNNNDYPTTTSSPFHPHSSFSYTISLPSSHPHSNFPYTSDDTTLLHLAAQQPEAQQKLKNNLHNNNCAVSSPSHPHSTFSCASDNTNSPHFVAQEPKMQQKQKKDFCDDCAVPSSSLHLHSTFSCASDNTSLSHFMAQQLELKQNQNENLHNNDRAVLLSPHTYSTFSYKDDSIVSLHFVTQKSEIEENQKDKRNNNDYVVSPSPYPHSSSFDFNTNADWNTIIDYFRF
ncbi:5459_t:CDS:2 [Entrophospora sp. SA101]|nr:15276_t:CDS:2 [Entrophospora sp. SA101]CAJ0626977.1 5459_t:CDS:2 [Entrophospora sp. SA101]CAJ0840239.1 12550_t:CDS:2 [Entrophospora sp. SA101]CAJ0847860.1 1522_t:CDS:2 [Entrophospora sp. SA101]CAJ0859105.1 13235_t:CDS:2 [Entrophospora sp. SA101]